MTLPNRRDALKWTAAAAAGAMLGRTDRAGAAEPPTSPDDGYLPAPQEKPHDFRLEPLGKVQPVASKRIEASPLSVGFETLDRQHFDPTRTYDLLAASGTKWARCQTGWNRCERVAGQYTFEWLDEVVDRLLEIGVQPWFNLGYGNKLYTPEKPDDYSVGWAPIFEASAREGWVRFVRAVAARFRDRVKHWEIWNEPNISGFWKPRQPNAKDYADMVKLTAPEIRRLVPDSTIIGASLAGMPRAYLAGCLEAGMAEHVDIVSYHPYRPVPEAGYAAEVAEFRRMLDAVRPGIGLWQGENGCPSRGGAKSAGALSKLPWDERQQAKWALRRLMTDLKLRVELTSYFHTVDLVGYRGITNYKGLLRGSDYTPKPAFCCFQYLAALFDAQTRADDDLAAALVLEPAGGAGADLLQAGFTRGGRGIWAYWCVSKLPTAWTVRSASATIALPPDAAGAARELERPALVDLMSGTVYRLPGTRQEGRLRFDDLPLLDYPLLIADAATILPA
jgi:polysaccharide biosynthesis protein PslG